MGLQNSWGYFIYSTVNNPFEVVPATNLADGNSFQACEKHKPRQNLIRLYSPPSHVWFWRFPGYHFITVLESQSWSTRVPEWGTVQGMHHLAFLQIH